MPLSGLSNMPSSGTVPLVPASRVPALPGARPVPARSREAITRLFGDYSYVKRDLRHIAALTVSALVLLVILSFVLPHLLT